AHCCTSSSRMWRKRPGFPPPPFAASRPLRVSRAFLLVLSTRSAVLSRTRVPSSSRTECADGDFAPPRKRKRYVGTSRLLPIGFAGCPVKTRAFPRMISTTSSVFRHDRNRHLGDSGDPLQR